MKFQFKKYLFLLLLPLLTIACETVVKIDLPDDPSLLTVNAVASRKLPWRVRVAESLDVLEVDWNTQFKTPNNTQVTVSGPEGEIALTYEPYCETEDCNTIYEEGQGLFISEEMRPIPGNTYTISVTAPGFETVTATERVPEQVLISDVKLNEFSQNTGVDEGFFTNASISWEDPAGVPNYYVIEAYGEVKFVEPIWDSLGNEVGRDSSFRVVRLFLESNDPIVQDAESYSYFINGGRGNVLLFSDATFDGQKKTMKVSQNNYREIERLTFVLRNVSESYWRYFLSYDQQYLSDDNPLAQPVQVFSNVNNGYGLFATFAADSVGIVP